MIVDTTAGQVRGEIDGAVARFLGIPYATADRFAPPRPPARWDGVRDALEFGPIAPQPAGSQFQRADLVQDEDCLSLNIWTPAPASGVSDAARPVMVWIHGGAFRQGSGASPLYDGAPLAERGDVVVVTINYRLGVLGFLAHPSLAVDSGLHANWGLLDQVEALRWVRDNIAAFGGDAGNVTIFGESAGAASVSLLLSSPGTQGLFHKAIAQSGAPVALPAEMAAGIAEQVAAAVGVDDVAELRDVPLEQLTAAQDAVAGDGMRTFVPTIDGALLPRSAFKQLRDGVAARVPTMIGTNVDEWKLWAPADPHSRDLDEDGLHRRVERVLPKGVSAIIDTFRAERSARGEPTNPADLWFAIETDRFFRALAIRAADAQHAAGAPTFTYLFEWGSPAMKGWLGACHGLEIAFVFGNQGRAEIAAFTGSGPEADAVADSMMEAWIAFAHTGDPSTAALAWPAHDPETRPTMCFNATSHVELAPRDAERAVVDAHL